MIIIPLRWSSDRGGFRDLFRLFFFFFFFALSLSPAKDRQMSLLQPGFFRSVTCRLRDVLNSGIGGPEKQSTSWSWLIHFDQEAWFFSFFFFSLWEEKKKTPKKKIIKKCQTAAVWPLGLFSAIYRVRSYMCRNPYSRLIIAFTHLRVPNIINNPPGPKITHTHNYYLRRIIFFWHPTGTTIPTN